MMKWMIRAAVAGSCAYAILIVLTLSPIGPDLPFWLLPGSLVVVLLIAFPLITVMQQSMATGSGWKRRVSPLAGWRLVRHASRRFVYFGVITFVGGWLIAVLTLVFGGVTGVPELRDGQYVVANKGNVRVVSEQEYRSTKAGAKRLFAAAGMAVLGATAWFGSAAVAKEAKLGHPELRGPQDAPFLPNDV